MITGGTYDVVIAGGGPAAVSAAILLGRCMRRVLLCDASHSEPESLRERGDLSGKDCCCPFEFLRASRTQLNRLDTVSCVRASVQDVHRDDAGFRIVCDKGRKCLSKSLLLASDLVTRLPDIPDAKRFLGASLHQCPYCEGWEHHGQRIGVVGNDEAAVAVALKLLMWAPRVTLFTHGGKPSEICAARLSGSPVDVVTGSVRSLEGRGQHLESVRMENGSSYPCEALFFYPEVRSYFDLASRVGSDSPNIYRQLQPLPDGGTGVQGLFVTGESDGGLEMAVSAAANGVRIAESINQWLSEADRSYLAAPSYPNSKPWTTKSNAI